MKRFRVAIFGTSFGRSVQAVAFKRHAGFDLVAIVGHDPAKARRIADELGIARGEGDWRAVLAHDPPDLVSIVTPVDLHHPMMMAALEAGCHVHCEKPTAMHRFQAADMRDRARVLGRVAGINHEFRFQPARRTALDLVRGGGIGRPRRGAIIGRYALWHHAGSRGMNWLADAARGGGILGALGSHHTDCLRLFFGEPTHVRASVRVDQPLRGPADDGRPRGVATADDAVTLEYTFAEGGSALIDLNAHAPYRFERFEVEGDEATIRWDAEGKHLWRLAPGKEEEAIEIPAPYRLVHREGEPALVAPFEVMLDQLHRALSGEAPMTPDFDDAVAVQSALDAARASSASGARVAVLRPGQAMDAESAKR